MAKAKSEAKEVIMNEYDHLIGTRRDIKIQMKEKIRDNWKIEGGLCPDATSLGKYTQVIWR